MSPLLEKYLGNCEGCGDVSAAAAAAVGDLGDAAVVAMT